MFRIKSEYFPRKDRSSRRAFRVLLGVFSIVAFMVVGIVIFQMFGNSPSGRNKAAALAIHGHNRLRLIAEDIQKFQSSNGRFPVDLEELRKSPYCSSLQVKSYEKELQLVYLGESGRPADVLMYCLPGGWDGGSVSYTDFKLNVHQESHRRWMEYFRRKMKDLEVSDGNAHGSHGSSD